jgi:hypothetical protein
VAYPELDELLLELEELEPLCPFSTATVSRSLLSHPVTVDRPAGSVTEPTFLAGV